MRDRLQSSGLSGGRVDSVERRLRLRGEWSGVQSPCVPQRAGRQYARRLGDEHLRRPLDLTLGVVVHRLQARRPRLGEEVPQLRRDRLPRRRAQVEPQRRVCCARRGCRRQGGRCGRRRRPKGRLVERRSVTKVAKIAKVVLVASSPDRTKVVKVVCAACWCAKIVAVAVAVAVA